MNNNYLVGFCVYVFIFIILFVGGIIGLVFINRYISNIREIEKTDRIEDAIVTKVVRKIANSSTKTVYFRFENDEKTHETKFYFTGFLNFDARAGEKIEVKCNKERTLFFITNYSHAFYRSYFILNILFTVCILLSLLSLYSIIGMYKRL